MERGASAARGVFVALDRARGRFTVAGRWVLMFTAVFYVLGFLGDRYQFLVVAAIMIPLIAMSIPLARASLRGVEIRVSTPARAVAGRPFRLAVEVKKRRGWITARALEVLPPSSVRGLAVGFAQVRRGETVESAGRFLIQHRGVVQLDNVRVTTRFPFGLYERSARVAIDRAVIVHPAPARIGAVELPIAGLLSVGAGKESRAIGHDEFFGLRELVPGDRVRNICWRASARRGQLVVREFHAESEHEVELIVHPPRGASAREVSVLADRAASVAAALLERLTRAGLRVRLDVRGGYAGQVVVAGHARQCTGALDLLARYGPGTNRVEPPSPIPGGERDVRRRVHVVPGASRPPESEPHDVVVPIARAVERSPW